MMRPATAKQQKYLDLAAKYTERAMNCGGHEQWHEAAINFGSALESLLRIRFGSSGKLAQLVDKFAKDSLFDCIAVHEDGERKCPTCFADKVRKLRNAVHPECWEEATKKDVDDAASMVFMLHHVLVACDGSRIAAFRESADSPLVRMESSGISVEAIHQSQCKYAPVTPMKKGMKLSGFTPIETEYENAAAFPDEQSADSYCKEMNSRYLGWTVEEGVFNGEPCWKVVWLGH